MDKLVRQYSTSAKAAGREAAVKREIAAARQALSRAEMLYDSLYQNYTDKLMSEREYTEMKQQYRSDMERAQARLNELEQRQKAERQQTTENPWLCVFPGGRIETAWNYRDELKKLILDLQGDHRDGEEKSLDILQGSVP